MIEDPMIGAREGSRTKQYSAKIRKRTKRESLRIHEKALIKTFVNQQRSMRLKKIEYIFFVDFNEGERKRRGKNLFQKHTDSLLPVSVIPLQEDAQLQSQFHFHKDFMSFQKK